MVGRARECERIDQLVSTARTGRGQVLFLVGEAGVGKTVLLDYLETRAGDGVALVRLAGNRDGVQALDTLDRLLTASGARVEPSGTPRGADEPIDRFSAGRRLVERLSHLADQRALLVLIDDAHEVDASSLDAVRFAMARLGDDAVTVVLAARPDPELLTALPPFERLEVAGIPEDAAGELLGDVAPAIAHELWEATGGNPLAMIQLAETGAGAGTGHAVGRSGEPLRVAPIIEEAFLARAARLAPAPPYP